MAEHPLVTETANDVADFGEAHIIAVLRRESGPPHNLFLLFFTPLILTDLETLCEDLQISRENNKKCCNGIF
jgi:hypothetical protein